MSYQHESFGMMDEGYFVPRGEILTWLNDLLCLNLNKIQQLGSGAVYCQVTDVIHPGSVTLNKINWKAKNDYEFIANFKILTTAFQKAGIKRYVEVQKLVKAKYQDNLEFIQWLKRYYDINCGGRGDSYPAEEKRGHCPVDFSFADKNVVPKSYNASGQVVKPKDNVPPPVKRAPSINSREVTQRLASPKERKVQNHEPVKSPRPVVNRAPTAASDTKKREDPPGRQVPKDSHKDKVEPAAKVEKPPVVKAEKLPPKVERESKIQTKAQTKVPKSSKELKIDPAAVQKIKVLEEKLAMIETIVASEDSDETKLYLLREILGIVHQQKHETSQQAPASNQNTPQKQSYQEEEQLHEETHEYVAHEEHVNQHDHHHVNEQVNEHGNDHANQHVDDHVDDHADQHEIHVTRASDETYEHDQDMLAENVPSPAKSDDDAF